MAREDEIARLQAKHLRGYTGIMRDGPELEASYETKTSSVTQPGDAVVLG